LNLAAKRNQINCGLTFFLHYKVKPQLIWFLFTARFNKVKLIYSFSVQSGISEDAATATEKQCSWSQWTDYNGDCYKFFFNDANGLTAEEDCIAKGGHLTSVHSSDEDNFLQGLAGLYN
jgi:hypothetical protein